MDASCSKEKMNYVSLQMYLSASCQEEVVKLRG